MSVITRLVPDTSDDSGGDLDPNTGTGATCLADDNDGTYVTRQLSSFEPVRHLEGSYGNLPVGVGRVNSAQVGVRADTDLTASCALTVYTNTGEARISVSPMADTPTQHLSASITAWTTASQVDALSWGLSVTFLAHSGVSAFVRKLWLDVDWDPAIGGFKAFLFSVLGPLVAVGLHEMPGIAAEVLRRSRTLIPPDECVRAWRELREDRGRRYFPLGA
jgi:hypothetical protein